VIGTVRPNRRHTPKNISKTKFKHREYSVPEYQRTAGGRPFAVPPPPPNETAGQNISHFIMHIPLTKRRRIVTRRCEGVLCAVVEVKEVKAYGSVKSVGLLLI
jgi:hypothetical protein